MTRFLIGAAVAALSVLSTQPAAAQTAAAKPSLGTFGLDTAGMDKAVKPGDDFYAYVNGGWAAKTEIPADKPWWGGFVALRDLSDQRTRTLIEEVSATAAPKGSNAQKVGDFFASFMDEAAIEAKGITPLKGDLDAIAALRTPADLGRLLGELNRTGGTTPIGIGPEQDLKDNSRYTIYVSQGGLGMPDRDYYLVDDAKFVETRAKYLAHVAAMLKLAGISEPEARAQRIFELEKKIAQTHWTRAESREIDKLYNPVAMAEIATRVPGFDWRAFTTAAGVADQPTLVLLHPSAIEGTAKLIQYEPMASWQDYLTYHAISDAAGTLPKAFVEENFAFNGTVLSGTPQLKERWKRGVDQVNAALGEAVGQLYVARYFPPDAKAKADALVANLIKAMDLRLQKLEWMAPETKDKARVKLAAFKPRIGYPDKWRDYAALDVVRGDAFGNARRAAEFEYRRQIAKIGKPVDRDEWRTTPQTVNAFANPLRNEIVFPAAILQAPFFDPNADPAINYGGIGAVIGHEISHHFDDQGRKFDASGNMVEWWTPQDVERFKAYTDRVVAQYGAYEALPGLKVNGQLTLGENMADLAGLNVAHDAYLLSLGGKPAPVIDGYSGEQRFFLGFGQVWRTKMRDAFIKQIVTTDPHTPGNLRAYVVRNLDAWYGAFDVKPDTKYYLAPADRIKVW